MAAERSCDSWPKLSEEEVASRMDTIPAWRVVQGEDGTAKLERRFTALNFQAAMDFIVAAGAIAEQRNHHPDLHLWGYRNVTIQVFSHGLKGITDNDFALCRTIDSDVKVIYSPKFLKEHPELGDTP